jgi:hypothetical protein
MTVSPNQRARTNVYIDGFNLFHGCLKDGPCRWLDLAAFCRSVLPGDAIECIRYFTAVITARPGHPNATQHQLTYLRALATIPNLSIDYGHFLTSKTRMKPVQPVGGHHTVEVWKTEEKGSDVNIATRILCDAFDGAFDVAVIVSNDSDLVPPIREIRRASDSRLASSTPRSASPIRRLASIGGRRPATRSSGRPPFIGLSAPVHLQRVSSRLSLPMQLGSSPGRRVGDPENQLRPPADG